jgi:hypothetical protein
MTDANSRALERGVARAYAGPGLIVGSVVAWLVLVTAGSPAPVAPEALIRPMVALFGTTAIVWLAMLLARNTAVIRGRASVRYYADYASNVPDERIERPARTFNNLMQAPTLFYVVCVLMLVTRTADEAQLALAWTFVVLRAVHAIVYISWNYVPYRLAMWLSSCIALGVLWFRFAMHAP